MCVHKEHKLLHVGMGTCEECVPSSAVCVCGLGCVSVRFFDRWVCLAACDGCVVVLSGVKAVGRACTHTHTRK